MRDGTAELVSRDEILRRERRQGNIVFFPCSADHVQFSLFSGDHVQDWQSYPVDPYSVCDVRTKKQHMQALGFKEKSEREWSQSAWY